MARPFLMAARVKVEVPVLMVTVVDAADAVAEEEAAVVAEVEVVVAVEAEEVVVEEVVVEEVGVAAVVGEAAEVVVRAV